METKNEAKKRLIINVGKETYRPGRVRRTMNVCELKKLLEDFYDDSPVILSFNEGYTYAGMNEEDFDEQDIDPNEE